MQTVHLHVSNQKVSSVPLKAFMEKVYIYSAAIQRLNHNYNHCFYTFKSVYRINRVSHKDYKCNQCAYTF